jgi:indole-3-acetate monooxygenase
MLKRAEAGEGGVGGDCVARARELAPLVQRASPRIEAERKIPQDVLSALHAARMFRMLIPRSCGGDEVTPMAFFEAIEAIAKADGSTAWCLSQGSGVSMAAAYLKTDVARDIFGDARAVAASGSSSIIAKAVAVDGGYRVTGAWRYASGSRHSTWFGGHCIIHEADGTPRLDADGKPVERTMLFPAAEVTTTDVWQVVGLRGTGSDDYAVRDVFVPLDYAFTRESAADRREPGPLYRFSIFNVFGIGFAGVALGIARTALDAFVVLARDKTPMNATRPLRDSAVIQSHIGLAETKLRAARAFLLQTVQELWDTASSGASFSLDQRVMLRATTCYAINLAKEVVDVVYHAAGGSAIFESNPFERRFRDINTVTQQAQASLSNFEVMGQSLLGLTPAARL